MYLCYATYHKALKVHVAAGDRIPSFLKLNETPLHGCTLHLAHPFIHQWTFGLCGHLAIVNHASPIWVHKYLFKTPLSLLLNIKPKAKLLGHMVILKRVIMPFSI